MIFDETTQKTEKQTVKPNTNHIEVKTFVNSPIKRYEIPYFKQNKFMSWLRTIFKKNPVKTRNFTLYKVRVINMGRFAEIAYKIPELNADFETKADFINFMYPLIKNHRSELIYLCAVSLYNQHDEPPNELIDFLSKNIDSAMLFDIIFNAVNQEDLLAFMNAIILVKGTNINFARVEDVSSATTQV